MMHLPKFILVGILSLGSGVFAKTGSFRLKEAKEFKTLENYKSVEAFEAVYEKHIQDCRDNWVTAECELLAHAMWDRELNVYYKKLMAKLKDKDKNRLKVSQREWLESRDSTRALTRDLLTATDIYGGGEMSEQVNAGEEGRLLVPLVKYRALWLKALWESFLNFERPPQL